MLDRAIQNFLSERLKKKSDSPPTELELIEELNTWLPTATKKADKLFRITHPVKFSHPDAKNTSEIRVSSEPRPDGFLRTGNAAAELDTIFDTAANIPIWKFLSVQLDDGKTVLEHLEQDSDVIKQQLTLTAMPYNEVREGLLGIYRLSDKVSTSEKIKQVYFPVSNDYHLLSLLTPSGLMFELKRRINQLRFSDTAKQAREDRRNSAHNAEGFDELYDLTVIGFGGTKPQNISVLNNQNGGTAYLLPSMPPPLHLRTTRIPTSNFFRQTLYVKDYADKFKALHNLFMAPVNNQAIRDGRDYWIMLLVEQVMEIVWALRELDSGWSERTTLPAAQKTWLDATHTEIRETSDDWLEQIIVNLSDWLIITYRKSLGEHKAIAIGDEELKLIKQLIRAQQEVLR